METFAYVSYYFSWEKVPSNIKCVLFKVQYKIVMLHIYCSKIYQNTAVRDLKQTHIFIIKFFQDHIKSCSIYITPLTVSYSLISFIVISQMFEGYSIPPSAFDPKCSLATYFICQI